MCMMAASCRREVSIASQPQRTSWGQLAPPSRRRARQQVFMKRLEVGAWHDAMTSSCTYANEMKPIFTLMPTLLWQVHRVGESKLRSEREGWPHGAPAGPTSGGSRQCP